MYTIVGSGFGLYGYLPALIERGAEGVILPVAYRDRFERRAELDRYRDAIHWVEDHDAAFAAASGVVIAVSPSLQPAAASRAVAQSNVREIVLEKPIAITPDQAMATLRLAVDRRVRVGYTLLHTDWYQAFRTALAVPDCARVHIQWHFMAHHFRHGIDTWKRFHGQGGGVLRFYGIHLVALLADAGYVSVAGSQLETGPPDEPERWKAAFSGPGLPPCAVDLNSRAPSNRFAIIADGGVSASAVVDEVDAFASEAGTAGQDRRVASVVRLIRSFGDEDERWNRLYAATNLLWAEVEARTGRSAAAAIGTASR